VVVTVLHNAFVDCTDLWSYLCTPVVAIVVSKVDLSILIHILEGFDKFFN
jgi:hypothetical protein